MRTSDRAGYRSFVIDPRRIEVIDDATAKLYRGMSPTRKMELLAEMCRAEREIVEADLRSAHPDFTDADIRCELLRRLGVPESIAARLT
jgi:hypothetical protein